MKKLVIFDLDGTLINTLADLAYSTNYALEACGYPTHPADEYRFFVGNGILKLFERALPEEARIEAQIRRIRDLFLPHYDRNNTARSTPYPGIPELLTHLQEEGYTLAVASNKYQEATTKIIAALLPQIHFACVLGQREGVPVKPDPTIVQEILAATGYTPEETLYIGDSNVDMCTARNAGVTACGVTWGFRPRNELASHQPEYIVDRAADIRDALHELNPLRN